MRQYHTRNVSSHSFLVGDFILRKIQMTKDRHKLSPTWEGPYEMVQVTIKAHLHVIKVFVVHFLLLPATLAQEANTSVRGLHYVIIYISYNEIYFMLHLFYFYTNNILASAVIDFT
jgi:hypothetical protein